MHHDFIDRYGRLESPVHSLDPRAKIVALFALIIVCVITPPQEWWPFCIYAAVVVVIAAASRVPPRYLLTRVLVVLPFIVVVAVFVPFMHKGEPSFDLGLFHVSREGLIILWGVTVKALISVACLILLSATTPFNDLMHGFERLHAPHFFTTTAAFMYRYIFVIIDEAERMGRARDSRNSHGRWPVSYTHLRAHEPRHDLVCRLLLEKKNRRDKRTKKRIGSEEGSRFLARERRST